MKEEKEIDFMNEDYKPSAFEKIKWWFEDLRYKPKQFVEGIKNLWKWFPIIWKDRDWDTSFIFEMFKFKIKNQSNYIGTKDRHVSAKRDAEIMMTVVKLMDRVQNEFYQMEYMDYRKTKHKFVLLPKKNPTDEGMYEWVSEELSENFDEYFAKYPRQYKRVLSGEINRFRGEPHEKGKNVIASEIAHENHIRCRKLLFKLMEENIEKWWD